MSSGAPLENATQSKAIERCGHKYTETYSCFDMYDMYYTVHRIVYKYYYYPGSHDVCVCVLWVLFTVNTITWSLLLYYIQAVVILDASFITKQIWQRTK